MLNKIHLFYWNICICNYVMKITREASNFRILLSKLLNLYFDILRSNHLLLLFLIILPTNYITL